MNKICRNNKNYKLTVGKEYEILQEDGNNTWVINDNNKTVKYSNLLFDLIPEEVITTPPLPRTEQDCIDSIIYTINNLSYTDINNNQKTITVNLLNENTSAFSCGIVRITGINNLINYLNVSSFVNTQDHDYIELKKALFKKVFDKKIEIGGTYGMWMCSTNKIDNNEDYFSLLDEMSDHSSEWFLNPNSSNQIKIWYGIINQDFVAEEDEADEDNDLF